ncbi:MAG: M20/M25/M40 family metallo-hydrolase [Gemmatimonadales bacterium]
MQRTNALSLIAVLLALAGLSCGRAPGAGPPLPDTVPADPRALLSALAADSMEGRATATAGSARAARLIAGRMRALGLEPAGDSGYFQRVPLTLTRGADGARGLQLLGPGHADSAPAGQPVMDVNVIGLLRGADSALGDEAVVVGAHFDHLGIGAPVAGDSIYNGADDDASGVVAVLGAAQALAGGPLPRRTVVFLITTGEEQGLLGTRWYIDHPAVPLERTVADLQVEMIGRPDSLAGGPGRAWLTGYERSTMGRQLAAAGIPVVDDPRPAFDFFLRSDNIAFARRGIPAHTLSSYNLHTDYHQPSDEVERVDFDHLARLLDATARAVRVLADGDAPRWNPGGRPEPSGAGS